MSCTFSLVVVTALGDLLCRLDADPGRRGRQFERICQWFLMHAPVYTRELRHVWLWADWPGRWGADAGIDLVAQDRRGPAGKSPGTEATTYLLRGVVPHNRRVGRDLLDQHPRGGAGFVVDNQVDR